MYAGGDVRVTCALYTICLHSKLTSIFPIFAQKTIMVSPETMKAWRVSGLGVNPDI